LARVSRPAVGVVQMRLAIVSRVDAMRNSALTTQIDAMQADQTHIKDDLKTCAQQREKRLNLDLDDAEKAALAAADALETASNAIATGTNNLTSRTKTGASQLLQAASSMKALSGTVLRQLVATMQDIHASARRLSDIIGTINGIAFQTRIPALNAALEAARAA
jgi:methyl-accepting chemotaxis protein